MESEKKNRIGSLRRYRLPEEFYLYCLMALLALVSMAVVTQVRSETIVVEAQGRGPSRSDAISSALVAAVEQASGLQIEANSVLRQELSSISNGAESKHNLTGTHQMEVLRHTGGIVKSYEIISVESATDGSFNALLRVDIQRYSSPGLQTQDRRRIVVALPLNLASAEPSELAVMRDALNSYLVQTRRFAVLDRENDATYRKEMELLESPDVPLAETVRIGQVIGADYILLSKIRELEAASDDQALPITGRKVSRNRAILSVGTPLLLFIRLSISTKNAWARTTHSKNSRCEPLDETTKIRCLDATPSNVQLGLREYSWCEKVDRMPPEDFISRFKRSGDRKNPDLHFMRYCSTPICVQGRLNYVDQDGHPGILNFSTMSFLALEPPAAKMSPSASYDVFLEAGKSNYTKRISISQQIKPGEADNFSIRIATDRSATFDFDMDILAVDSSVAWTGSFNAALLVPRSALICKNPSDVGNVSCLADVPKHR
jgi:hypothetical protein